MDQCDSDKGFAGVAAAGIASEVGAGHDMKCRVLPQLAGDRFAVANVEPQKETSVWSIKVKAPVKKPFCDIKARVDVSKHYTKFGYMHESGVWLYGEPDEVLYRADDSIVIWDHKTAHPKDEGKIDRFCLNTKSR